jgi:hypothetical protein
MTTALPLWSDALVRTEIQATPLAQQISESAYHAIGEDARHVLARFAESSGAVILPLRARIVSATSPESADSTN